jgi:hypothetical protein
MLSLHYQQNISSLNWLIQFTHLINLHILSSSKINSIPVHIITMWPPQQHQVSCIAHKTHHYEAFYTVHLLATFEVLPAGCKRFKTFWGVMLCYWVIFWWIIVLSTQWKMLINHTASQYTRYKSSAFVLFLFSDPVWVTLCPMSKHLPECSYNKCQWHALFLNFILVKNSACFGQIYCPSLEES